MEYIHYSENLQAFVFAHCNRSLPLAVADIPALSGLSSLSRGCEDTYENLPGLFLRRTFDTTLYAEALLAECPSVLGNIRPRGCQKRFGRGTNDSLLLPHKSQLKGAPDQYKACMESASEGKTGFDHLYRSCRCSSVLLCRKTLWKQDSLY